MICAAAGMSGYCGSPVTRAGRFTSPTAWWRRSRRRARHSRGPVAPVAPGDRIGLGRGVRRGRVLRWPDAALNSPARDGRIGELEVLLRTALADAMFVLASGSIEEYRAEQGPVDIVLPLEPGAEADGLLAEASRRIRILPRCPPGTTASGWWPWPGRLSPASGSATARMRSSPWPTDAVRPRPRVCPGARRLRDDAAAGPDAAGRPADDGLGPGGRGRRARARPPPGIRRRAGGISSCCTERQQGPVGRVELVAPFLGSRPGTPSCARRSDCLRPQANQDPKTGRNILTAKRR